MSISLHVAFHLRWIRYNISLMIPPRSILIRTWHTEHALTIKATITGIHTLSAHALHTDQNGDQQTRTCVEAKKHPTNIHTHAPQGSRLLILPFGTGLSGWIFAQWEEVSQVCLLPVVWYWIWLVIKRIQARTPYWLIDYWLYRCIMLCIVWCRDRLHTQTSMG